MNDTVILSRETAQCADGEVMAPEDGTWRCFSSLRKKLNAERKTQNSE